MHVRHHVGPPCGMRSHWYEMHEQTDSKYTNETTMVFNHIYLTLPDDDAMLDWCYGLEAEETFTSAYTLLEREALCLTQYNN